ncbi:hypothetical protein [Flagellimonas flava]|uniref:hypothetical protein n=1 Tax=Flagellimonas flava TaxID=570519 RepID=UPI003D654A21
MEYLVDGKKFGLSYKNLKNRYQEFIEMDDDTFLANIIDAAHFAIMVCYLKEIPTYLCLSDTGIVHELVHLMTPGQSPTELKDIRETFKEQLKLS